MDPRRDNSMRARRRLQSFPIWLPYLLWMEQVSYLRRAAAPAGLRRYALPAAGARKNHGAPLRPVRADPMRRRHAGPRHAYRPSHGGDDAADPGRGGMARLVPGKAPGRPALRVGPHGGAISSVCVPACSVCQPPPVSLPSPGTGSSGEWLVLSERAHSPGKRTLFTGSGRALPLPGASAQRQRPFAAPAHRLLRPVRPACRRDRYPGLHPAGAAAHLQAVQHLRAAGGPRRALDAGVPGGYLPDLQFGLGPVRAYRLPPPLPRHGDAGG